MADTPPNEPAGGQDDAPNVRVLLNALREYLSDTIDPDYPRSELRRRGHPLRRAIRRYLDEQED